MPTKEEWQNAFAARHGEKLQKVFSSSVVAVCGLGGLGSNIATALARAGIGKLILIDFDSVDLSNLHRVDLSNLHRQQYKASQIGKYKTDAIVENLCEINPNIRTEAHTIRLTEENALPLLSQADVICEAFDNPQAKAMLCNLVLEKLPQKIYVGASGMAGIDSPNLIKTKRVSKRFYLCGDGVNGVGESDGLFASRVMLCAAHQAHTVMRVLAEKYEV